ncbi:MAG: transcriptional repressor LexA [Candidatus Moranbacteria bacterium]|nr:transcriptional repressor LexA [Candidatus Moranbacteria bacterium]
MHQKNITSKQKKVLELIYDAIKNSGFPPSFADLKESLKVSSNQSVLNFLKSLEKKGLIKREEGQARGIKILRLGYKILEKEQLVPYAGTSSAGAYIESFTNVFEKWSVFPGGELKDEKLKISDEDVFVIQVHGDSMINAEIDDGDMLLIKKTGEFKSGDIVIARSDDGTTVKRFIADGGKRYLKPENPNYENIPIIPGEINFEGKVILNLSKVK